MGIVVDVILPIALAFIMFSLGIAVPPGDDYQDTGFSSEFHIVASNFEHLAEQLGV